MAKESKKALVPKMRFPEFRDDPEWADAKLEELITTITPPAKLPSSNYLQIGKYPIVDQSQQAICGWTDDASAVIDDAWPLIVFGDHTCALKLIRQPFAQGADGIKILKARAGISTEYLFHSLSHQPLAMEDYKRHFSILKERLVFYPGFETGEQQKIADCLSSLDALVTTQGRKVEAFKTYKRGLMQQLFPREGETRPRLRFPEFRDAPEWEEGTLSDIASISSGTTPPRANPEFYEGGTIPWVKTTDLNNSVIDVTEERITPKARAAINPVGSVLVAMYGGFKQIGRTGYLRVPAATNQALSVLRLRGDKVLPIYLLVWLNAKVEDWKRIASSSRKDPNITGSDVAAFPIWFPSPAEQQRVADCLSSLDAQIAAESKRLDTFKTHKKGLMQQIFPSLEEA